MVRLSQLVSTLGGRCAARPDPEIQEVHVDSRRVVDGTLFCALPGRTTDGWRFVPQALAAGASAILAPEGSDSSAVPGAAGEWAHWIHPAARRVAGEAAALVHGDPAAAQFTVGITGTNGKSTVAHLCRELLASVGRRPGIVGTLGVELADGSAEPATHTTPDATELARIAARNLAVGGDALVLEASSHALDQERLAGLDLDVAVFTNLSRDHLDYHGDLDAYAAAKARIFARLKPDGVALVHAGDPAAERMIAAASATGRRVLTFGTGSRSDLYASRLVADRRKTHLFLQGMGISRIGLTLPLVGLHNIENALAATAATLMTGASPSRVLEGLATVSLPAGRLERVDTGERGFDCYVDYAHTPDALERVLGALREVVAEDGGRLIVVFGCGGERDTGKRAPMGEVACRLADVVVVTSDNPRGEDPGEIVAQVLAGCRGGGAEVSAEVDRRVALRRALGVARPGDVVLVAGKGHETWQVSHGEKLAFDDRLVLAEELP